MPEKQTETETALLRRVGWRVLPWLVLLYLVAYLDRVNIGFAVRPMARDLHFSKSLFGVASGVFFLGYLTAQVPSSVMLRKVGARRWIALLMVIWGALSAATAFAHSSRMFLVLRFLLGVAEAGFYPGVIYTLTLWLPRKHRTAFTALFVLGIPLANIVGAPISSRLLLHSAGALHDWQWMLIAEAVPAIVLGALTPWMMASSPREAKWLSEDERGRLLRWISEDEPAEAEQAAWTWAVVVPLLAFCFEYFAMQFSLYALGFWMPQMLERAGMSGMAEGWTVSAVYVADAVITFLWARWSDWKGQPAWMWRVALLWGALGFLVLPMAPHAMAWRLPVLCIGLLLGASGGLSATAPHWSAVSRVFPGVQAAAAIAAINSIGNLGGFAGPSLLGWVAERTSSFTAGTLVVAAVLVCGVVATRVALRGVQRDEEPPVVGEAQGLV